MARCIEDDIIEIIPFECPPLQKIICENGKNQCWSMMSMAAANIMHVTVSKLVFIIFALF